MHYYKKNIGDYAKKAGRLSMLEHGAYTLLIDACYDRERFPTKEEAIDWCWARTAEEVASVQFILKKFFILEGDQYVQNRIKEELDKYHDNAKKNKEIAVNREQKRRDSRTRSSTKRARSVNEASPNQEPLTKNQEPLTNSKANNIVKRSSTEVAEVFECWQDTMKHPQSKLDDKRKKLIRSGLKIGYSVSDLKQAIIGCSLTPHNIGQNDRGQRYDGLNIILKSSDNIERFIENSRSPPKLALITATSQRGSGIQKMKELAGIR